MVNIRPYEPRDAPTCRNLWVQLVEHHRTIYDSPSIGGDDPGSEFDEYLDRPDRVMTWVAEDTEIVGLTGLLMDGNESEIEPVIVASDQRGEGIGRALMETAIEESRQRGVNDVNIRPVARNASAIEAFHRLGFQTIGHVQLFMRLDGGGDWLPGIELHGQAFHH